MSFQVVEELEQQEKQHFPGSPIIHRSAEKSSSEEPNIHAGELLILVHRRLRDVI